MVRDRVEFFEENDVLYGHNLNKIETMVIPDITQIGINDAIEFYEIKRYFDKGTRLKTWSDNEFQTYKEKTQKLFGLAIRFFDAIDNATIIKYFTAVEYPYHTEFWAMFNICKLFNKISDDTFEKLIYSDGIAPFDLFRYKNIVNHYGRILRNYIIEYDNSIQILMYVYEQDYKQVEKLSLPTELTGADICFCLEKYVDSDSPNANMLNSIKQMRYSPVFPISDELRLKAKRRYAKEIEKLSITGIPIEYGIQLIFSPDQNEEKTVEHIGKEFKVSYSTHWLLDTLDYPS
ncbi:hypothetical protein QVN85_10460, partial [Oscillibacter valericigenes]|nr:hypothetical protein [Oscillibacter valericigenes]